jgi:hypothetical protein
VARSIQLHAFAVLQLLADCRQVFLADELGTALALSGEAKSVARAVLFVAVFLL